MPAEIKKIPFEDIRLGDKIRVVDVYDFTVAGLSHNYAMDEAKNVINEESFRAHYGGTRKFQLLDRPIEPLPTKPGSAVFIFTESNGFGAKWFLAGNKWVSETGREKTAEDLEAFISDYGFTFQETR